MVVVEIEGIGFLNEDTIEDIVFNEFWHLHFLKRHPSERLFLVLICLIGPLKHLNIL